MNHARLDQLIFLTETALHSLLNSMPTILSDYLLQRKSCRPFCSISFYIIEQRKGL